MKVHRGLLFVIGLAALVAMTFWFFFIQPIARP